MKIRIIQIIVVLALMISNTCAEDITPTIKTFMAGNMYNTKMSDDPAGLRWFADHFDFLINGLDDWDELKSFNPNLEAAQYTNLQMLGNRTDGSYTGWEYRAVMQYYDNAGISAESAFVHFADEVIEHDLDDGTRLINIAELHAHGNDSATRVSLRGWYNNSSDSGGNGSGYYPAGDGDWFCNIKSPTYRKFRAAAQKFIYQNVDSLLGFNNAVNYAYVDNFILDWGECTPGYWINGAMRRIIKSKGGPSGTDEWVTDVTYVDWDIGASILPNDATYLRQDMWDLLGEVQDSLEAAGFGGCIPNVSSSSHTALYNFVLTKHPAGLFYEYQGDNIVFNTYEYGWDRYVRRHDTVLLADNSCMQFWEYRFPTISDTSSEGAADLFMAALSSFLCFQNPESDYFKFGKLDSDYWFKGHEIDLGYPQGSWFDSSMTDASGATDQRVIFRKYEKGMVLFRPVMSASYNTSDTAADYGVWIDFGMPIYLVDANYDSTLVSEGRICIKPLEGIIFLYVSPLYSQVYPDIEAPESEYIYTCITPDNGVLYNCNMYYYISPVFLHRYWQWGWKPM